MIKLHVRELVPLDPQEVARRLLKEENIELTFDDGSTIKTNGRRTYYSSYAWEFHRQYEGVPLLQHHHVDHVLGGKPLNASTHIQLLENISKDVIFVHQLFLPEQKENILSVIYSATNRIHNEVTQYAEGHVTTIDLLDFIEVVDHDAIKMAIAELPQNVHSKDNAISQVYDKVISVIQNHPDFASNNLSRAVRARIVNNNQVLQCVAFRGFPSEVDGKVLKEPILTNFTIGNRRLYDYVAESRSAAKSHYFAEAPLEKAEYFSRRLQLLTMVIERIHYKDCGSKRYVNWIMRPPEVDDSGKVLYPGDLKFMVGKYYLAEGDTELKELKGDETYLYNKMIRMRSVLMCEDKDPHAICSTCFGALSQNVSKYVNIGHLCAATMTQQTSQSVLSTKHLDSSSRSTDIILNEFTSRYFTTTPSKSAYLVRKDFRNKDVKFIINRDQAVGLADVMTLENLDSLSLSRISSISELDFQYTEKDGGEIHTIPVRLEQDKRKAVFTMEYLKHLKRNRWQTDNKGNFVFDLKDWNFNVPPLMLPDMEYSYSDHSEEIASMIESSVENITERSKPNSPATTLQELFTKVNGKLSVNVALLEVILAAVMIPEQGSFGIGRGNPNAVLGVAGQLIKNRSLSNAYAFQDQLETILAPKNFFAEGRPDSVFDVFIAPREVLAYQHRRESLSIEQETPAAVVKQAKTRSFSQASKG